MPGPAPSHSGRRRVRSGRSPLHRPSWGSWGALSASYSTCWSCRRSMPVRPGARRASAAGRRRTSSAVRYSCPKQSSSDRRAGSPPAGRSASGRVGSGPGRPERKQPKGRQQLVSSYPCFRLFPNSLDSEPHAIRRSLSFGVTVGCPTSLPYRYGRSWRARRRESGYTSCRRRASGCRSSA